MQKSEPSTDKGQRNASSSLKKKDLVRTWVWFLVCSTSSTSETLPRVDLVFARRFGISMNANIPDHVDEYRAAVLLGMPQSELRRYSRVSGLGHVESDGKGQKVVFTYEELRRICLLVAQSSK